MYRVSFTGYRPSKLGFFSEDDPMCVDLKRRLAKQIAELYEKGADSFFSGMALGVDMWCAEEVVKLRELHSEVRLTAVLPCRSQAEKWSEADRRRYHDLLAKCDKVICVSEEYTKDCMFKRNRALVELCDLLVAVYDGKSGGTKYTVDYAAKLHRKTIVVPPM
ncbi:MAG: SLOG family protein [Oscillospiraceae bacterium]